jgi:hypothetical protein
MSLRVLPLSAYCSAICSARLIPCSSAAYTVDIVFAPMYVERVSCIIGHTAAAPVLPSMPLLSV